MNHKIAVLMAAGMGSRMRPLTEKIPKPLVKVHGIPMIETLIVGLRKGGVGTIYIVTGYKGEQFGYLPDKYPDIKLIANLEYETVNNISSLKAVGDILGSEDCYVCEADLYIRDNSIFEATLEKSCYFGKMVSGFSDDWVFELQNNRITRIGKGGTDTYNMVGISYFNKADAKVIADAIGTAYQQGDYEHLFWDEIVNQNLKKIDIAIHPVDTDQLYELDTIEELAAIDNSYMKK